MPRTVCSILTSLPGDELAARVKMFLHYHKFEKLTEEYYVISSWWWRNAYLKLVLEKGFLYIEAYYVHKYGREYEIGGPYDPHDMRRKIQELSKVIGDGPPMYYATLAAGQQQPYTPASGQLHASAPQQHASAGQQDAKGKSPFNKGCLTACLVVAIAFLCMLGGCITLGLLYQDPEEDSPIVKKAVVSTLGWKTRHEDRYSFRYPGEWTLYIKDNQMIKEFVNTKEYQNVLLSESSGGALGTICFEDSVLYDNLTEDNFSEMVFGGAFRGFTCDALERGAAKGKRALFALYSGELGGNKYKIYHYLIENDDACLGIWFLTSDSDYDKFQPFFDTIISTLKPK